MITREEIVPYGYVLNSCESDNVAKLIIVMNKIRAEYGMPMRVTSGFRSQEDEKRIDPAHPNSLHTMGLAVDIEDPDPERRLWNWCIERMDFLIEVGAWLEDRLYSKNHVHFQVFPPASGNRVFIP